MKPQIDTGKHRFFFDFIRVYPVRYHLGTKENLKTEVYRDYFPGFAYYRRGFVFWRGCWGGSTEVFNMPYDVSTLVLDIVDAKTNQLVWRGYDRKTLDLDRSDKTLEKAASNVVGRFEKDVRKDEKRMGRIYRTRGRQKEKHRHKLPVLFLK